MAENKNALALTKVMGAILHWAAVGSIALIISAAIAYVMAQIVLDGHEGGGACESRKCFQVLSARIAVLEAECAGVQAE